MCAAPAEAADSPHPHLAGGYQEAVLSVSDLDSQVEFYESVAGWQVLHRGELPRSILDAYALDAAATAREVVLGNPGVNRGYVRLLEFAGVEQMQIRSNAQSWDTGGWFDVNSRVLDMRRKFAQMQKRGWQSTSDPVEYSFGPFVVREWLARGPDGIVLALIERVEPPLEGWPELRELSQLFNASQVVTDVQEARDFYVDKLGFKIYIEHVDRTESPSENLLGLPHNVAVDVPRDVYILHPNGSNDGSIEILKFNGADGRDFSAEARPPNLGILTLRFPVIDLDAFVDHLQAQDVALEFPPLQCAMAPYGEVRLTAVRGPDGAWLEFFQIV